MAFIDGEIRETLSTHVAGYFASRGHAVMLGDADRQQSSRLWLGLRPATARPIQTWDIHADLIARPPRGTTHVVVDTPAGLHGWMVLAGLALIAQVASQSLIGFALSHLPAALSSTGLILQPVLAALFAWVLLNEPMAPLQMAGGVIVLIGIYGARRAG